MPASQAADDFATMVSDHLVVLRRYAARQVGERDADEVVQAALARAFRRRRHGAEPAQTRTWLLTLVRARAQRTAGRRMRRRRAEPTTGTTGSDAVLERALAALAPGQREAVDLCYFAGLGLADAAAALDRDPADVADDLRAALDAVGPRLTGAPARELADDRLREYAARWQRSLEELRPDEGPPAASDGLRARATVLLGAAAGFLVVVGLWSGWLLPSEPPEAGADAGALTARSSPAIAACRDGDLGIAGVRASSTLGTPSLRVSVRLVGDRPCSLRGFPEVTALDHGERLPVPVVRRPADGPVRDLPDVVVTAQRRAVVTLAWSTGDSCPQVDNDRLLIVLPGGVRPFAVDGFGEAPCGAADVVATAGPGSLDVFAIRSSAQRHRPGSCVRVTFAAPPECG